jgi:tRNA threonylcarbamoyladenosine biosynthesis protein TsaB
VRILAFDTATAATSVALVDTGAGVAREMRDDPESGRRPGHATRLLPLIAQLLQDAGLGWPDVERIAVGVGPGTFTGLRIGVSTARALAQARAIPLVGVSTLESLAVGAAAAGHAQVVTVLDARRREVFAAVWAPEGGPVAGRPGMLMEPRAMTPSALVQRLGQIGPGALAVGDGALAFREVIQPSRAVIPGDDSPFHRVSAIHHGHVAERLPAGHIDDVHPEYLRLPDAELNLRAAAKS